MSGFISGRGTRLTAKRMTAVLGVSALVFFAVGLIAPMIGIEYVDGRRVGFDVLSFDAFTEAGQENDVLWIRIPRVLAALLVGGALAGAGCALQALLRNPLADPFTLGISSGSSLAAVVAIRLGVEGAFGD